MAEGYLRHRIVSGGLDDLETDSAGTLGIRKARASEEAIEAMAEIGIDISDHRSKGVKSKILDGVDVTIAMSYDHLEFLASRFAEGEDQRLLLRAFENGPTPDANPHDLADPIGHPVDFYREQVQVIARCVDHLIDYLQRQQ